MPQLAALLSPSPPGVPEPKRADAAASAPTPVAVRLTLNGEAVETHVRPRVTLLDWLREARGLTGAKKGCNEGACGACTVLLDGQRVNGCLTLVVQCEGRELTTIEGLAPGDAPLHPVQQAFMDHDALQCGYCTPGQVLSAVACIAEGHAADADTVREWMSGNLCRCACYPQIVEAVLDAARRMAADRAAAEG
jgi:xanthine dehydrogenase YagT iron-sulfur-binding subunit